MTILTKSIKEVKELLSKANRPVGLVPTMGALHAGHISLINASKAENKTTVVSIFVNPLQFGPNEDLKSYPRDLEKDLEICKGHNVDIIFAPPNEEYYPDEIKNNLIAPPEELTEKLCGKFRKGHFSGVATAVKRLFEIIQPDNSYWGQKDLQQYYIIQWLIEKFNSQIKTTLRPTVREPTGLAYSSRNTQLTENEKNIAAAIYKSLKLAKENTKSGIFSISKSVLESLIFLSQFPELKVEYFEARDKDRLEKVDDNKKNNLYYFIAVKINNVRLIDNIEV